MPNDAPQGFFCVPATVTCSEKLTLALAAIVEWEAGSNSWSNVVISIRKYGDAREGEACARSLKVIECRPGFDELVAFTAALEPPS